MSDKRDEWVGLGEAAEILGVHPTTLRAWADNGDLRSRRTPGGHRRFRRGDLEGWERSPGEQAAGAQVMVQSALGRTRMEVGGGGLASQEWYANYDDDARQFHREMGRQLLALLTRYLTEPDQREAALSEAQAMGTQYAQVSFGQGLGIGEAVRAFLFFRDLLSDSVIQLAESRSLRTPGEWAEQLREVDQFTGAVLVALVQRYEQLNAA